MERESAKVGLTQKEDLRPCTYTHVERRISCVHCRTSWDNQPGTAASEIGAEKFLDQNCNTQQNTFSSNLIYHCWLSITSWHKVGGIKVGTWNMFSIWQIEGTLIYQRFFLLITDSSDEPKNRLQKFK